jgi:hypothetical protein
VKDKKKEKIADRSTQGGGMSRKDAMKRLGLTAFSAATMMILLNNPAKADDTSPQLPPDWT